MSEPEDLGVDLDAWQPPPPPGGIADAVIARLRAPARAAAIDPEERSPRRWWMIGGAVAALAAALLLAWGVTRGPVDGGGEVIAERARHLALGPSSAELDPGAVVRWQRDEHALAATQERGAATWRVGGDDTLMIDAGAMGASVEATGASLRVEVRMNLSDTRVIGASALTAAAVAMVTVIVYEGHVKVTSAGHSVNVAPGSSVEVRPAEPPREQLTVGAAPDRVVELEREIISVRRVLDEKALHAKQLEDRLAALEKTTDRPVDPDSLPDSLDRVMISTEIARIKDAILACGVKGYTGTVKATVKVAPSGKVSTVAISPGGAAPDACVRRLLLAAEFAPTRNGGSFSYPFAFSGCDADALAARGTDAFGSGQYATAIADFEAAYRCRSEAGFALRIVLAACRAKNAGKATTYWRKLTPAQRQSVQTVCVANGIPLEQLDGAR